MNSIWTFNENKISNLLTSFFESDNQSLLFLKLLLIIVISLFAIKAAFVFKKQWLLLAPITSAANHNAKMYFIKYGRTICELFLLKTLRAFLIGALLLSMVSYLFDQSNFTEVQGFVFLLVLFFYFWALVYYIIHQNINKTAQNEAENTSKTQGKSEYSPINTSDFDLNNASRGESERMDFTPEEISDAKQPFVSDPKKKLGPPRSKIKKEHDKKFYESREWRELRFQILNSHGRRCALCQTTEGVFHVDHIKPRSKYPHLELDPTNLQVLCEDCNLGKSDFY